MLDSLSTCVMLLVVGLVAVAAEGDTLSPDDQKRLVEYHNEQRDIWAAKSGQKAPHVVWDSTLTKRAEKYVRTTCPGSYQCGLVYLHDVAEKKFDKVLSAFGDKMKKEKGRQQRSTPRSECNQGRFCDYYSIINPKATKLGCAVGFGCLVQGKNKTVLACTYNSCRSSYGYDIPDKNERNTTKTTSSTGIETTTLKAASDQNLLPDSTRHMAA